MLELFRFFMVSDRRHRRRAVGAVVRLLRLVLDAEQDDMRASEDLLDSLDPYDGGGFPNRKYNDVEEECLSCEHAMGYLESAIDDLEFVY